MNNIGSMIAASAKLGLGYADRLLKDIKEEDFSAFASCGGTVIESNHPAFIFGHLSLYAPRIVKELGVETDLRNPPEQFQELFSKDATCVNDSTNTIYPKMDSILSYFKDGHNAAIDALQSAEDSVFHLENPNEAMRKLFPTIGAMHAFYVGGHFMMHMGQLSAWRRIAGLGAA